MNLKKKCPVKAILLDLDGTIVDSKRAYLEAVKTAFSALGVKTVDIGVVTEIPRRMEQNLPIDDLLNGIDARKFLKTYLDAYYKATPKKSSPMPDVSETLEKLSQRAKLAVITMRHVPKQEIIDELRNHGLAKYFDFVITALETPAPKPSPDALIICSQKMAVKTEECMVVGDSVADIRAGKKAGVRTVAVLSGLFSSAELKRENPDFILESLRPLPDLLETCSKHISPKETSQPKLDNPSNRTLRMLHTDAP